MLSVSFKNVLFIICLLIYVLIPGIALISNQIAGDNSGGKFLEIFNGKILELLVT